MLFVLCQNCGEVHDSQGGMGHACDPGLNSAECEHCGHWGTEMKYDQQNRLYRHRDPFSCIKHLKEEINHTGSDCLVKDDRYFKLEKKILDFVEGRRAAVEATREKKCNQSTG